MSAIAALLIGMIFVTGCSPAMIEEEQIRYERALFENAETIQEKLEILNEEFLINLFSVDRENDEYILIKLGLYSTPAFATVFEENTYPVLRDIDRRDFVSKDSTEWTKGFYVIDDVKIDAYQATSTVLYYQNDNLLQKQIDVIYIINDSADIKIVEMKEYEPIIVDKEKLSD